MPLHTDRSTYLLDAWTNQSATPAEEQELVDWLHQQDRSMVLSAYISDLENKSRQNSTDALVQHVDWEILFKKIILRREEPGMPESLQMMDTPATGKVVAMDRTIIKNLHLRKWGWVAAAVIFLAGIGMLKIFQSDSTQSSLSVQNPPKQTILPGRDGAILTLADGTQLVLDSANIGLIATQNGAEVILHNNQLTYQSITATSDTALYNTMQTPKGRHYKLQLPDGSIAWLNAASSITYPTAFNNKSRNVSITGEVYFEVAPNSIAPFTVRLENKMDVVVLGTSFNIQAYSNESTIQTTLIEGRVKVNGTILKPGEQAQLSSINTKGGSEVRVIEDVELSGVLAWKNGLFDFRGKGIEELMRQLERWYDIEVVYSNGVPAKRFDGKISRDLSLEDMLDGLERAGVRCRLEGDRKLVVLP